MGKKVTLLTVGIKNPFENLGSKGTVGPSTNEAIETVFDVLLAVPPMFADVTNTDAFGFFKTGVVLLLAFLIV
jgi:hypothetical protein